MPTLLTICLWLLTFAAIFASIATLRPRKLPQGQPRPSAPPWLLIIVVSCFLLLLARAITAESWQPLRAHVDGLLLLATLLGSTLLYLRSRQRMTGIDRLGLPLLALLLAWAICASSWTFQPFAVATIWTTVHLTSVYAGTFCSALSALGGGMYLQAQSRVRHKITPPHETGKPSLERLETFIIRSATLGFALLSLGLLTGPIVILAAGGQTRLGPGWWHSSKVLLSVAAWASYALILNVRHGSRFRGARAAWLSIAGLVLLLTTFGIVTRLHSDTPTAAPQTQPANDNTTIDTTDSTTDRSTDIRGQR